MAKKAKVINPIFVKDACNWKKMAGASELEKKLNSYLTCRFIISKNVPHDECLDEAKEIIELMRSYET